MVLRSFFSLYVSTCLLQAVKGQTQPSTPAKPATPAPTNQGTFMPTVSFYPTVSPAPFIKAVTSKPVATTRAPALRVTRAPTDTPTKEPVPATRKPTTDAPTASPTEAEVTETPTLVVKSPEPTSAPTKEEKKDTDAPTKEEVEVKDTDAPTAAPSPPPARATRPPTKEPAVDKATTATVNGKATPAPTYSGPSQRVVLRDLVLTLNGVARLDAESQLNWANITKTWYEDFYRRTEPQRYRHRVLQRLASAGIADFKTNLVITDQKVALSEQGDPMNSLTYAQELEYKIVDEPNLRTPEELVLIPFARSSDNADYVQRLQNGGIVFREVSSPLPPVVPGYNDQGDSSDDGGLSIPIIAGIAVGGAVLLGLLTLLICSRRKTAAAHEEYYEDTGRTKVVAQFAISDSEEVSTLHEPYGRPGNGLTVGDSGSIAGYGDQRYVGITLSSVYIHQSCSCVMYTDP
jgi:hypothetical protein